MAENHIQFVWERPKADQYDRTSHTKYMRTTPGAGGKSTTPRPTPCANDGRMTCVEVHAEWDGRAWLLTPPTGFISTCFPPSHTGYMAARPGTSTYGSFQPQRPCSTIPLGMHLYTGHAAVVGARGGPRGRTLPAGPGDGPHVFCMGGTAILGGFRSLPYKLYGVSRHMFCMAKGLHISNSGQGVARLLWYGR